MSSCTIRCKGFLSFWTGGRFRQLCPLLQTTAVFRNGGLQKEIAQWQPVLVALTFDRSDDPYCAFILSYFFDITTKLLDLFPYLKLLNFFIDNVVYEVQRPAEHHEGPIHSSKRLWGWGTWYLWSRREPLPAIVFPLCTLEAVRRVALMDLFTAFSSSLIIS